MAVARVHGVRYEHRRASDATRGVAASGLEAEITPASLALSHFHIHTMNSRFDLLIDSLEVEEDGR